MCKVEILLSPHGLGPTHSNIIFNIPTWQASFPPSRYPAHIILGVIGIGLYANLQINGEITGTSTALNVSGVEENLADMVPQPDTIPEVPASIPSPWFGSLTGWILDENLNIFTKFY